MKKLFAGLFAVVVGIAVIAPEQKAEAQVILYSNQCCDAYNVVRCIQVNMTPVGNACFCNGQGWGHTC
jgi:hypothetical protein